MCIGSSHKQKSLSLLPPSTCAGCVHRYATWTGLPKGQQNNKLPSNWQTKTGLDGYPQVRFPNASPEESIHRRANDFKCMFHLSGTPGNTAHILASWAAEKHLATTLGNLLRTGFASKTCFGLKIWYYKVWKPSKHSIFLDFNFWYTSVYTGPVVILRRSYKEHTFVIF